ncbi:MAG: protein jag, partial [Microthrixaceae bacterium]
KNDSDRGGANRAPARKQEASDGQRSGGGGRNGRRGGAGGQQERSAATAAAPKKEREQMDTAEQASTIEEFLTGLGTAFGLETTVEVTVEDDVVAAHIDGSEVGLLIGPRLGTLDAIQEISRNVLQRQADGREHGKVVVDVSNVREMRKQALSAFVTDAAGKVTESGDEVVFEVMSSADRKVVHDTVAELEGVESTSVGEDPRRRVVIRPS